MMKPKAIQFPEVILLVIAAMMLTFIVPSLPAAVVEGLISFLR